MHNCKSCMKNKIKTNKLLADTDSIVGAMNYK